MKTLPLVFILLTMISLSSCATKRVITVASKQEKSLVTNKGDTLIANRRTAFYVESGRSYLVRHGVDRCLVVLKKLKE